jgi:hypothetical protein
MRALIKTDEFKRVVKALKLFTRKVIDHYTGNEKMQYIMAEFNYDTQEVKFEALDGHRIAVEYVKCETDENFIAYIKPISFWKTDAEYTEIERVNELVTVDLGDYILRFKQPSGEWYQTEKMFTELEAAKLLSKICVNPDFVVDAVKSINKPIYGKGKVLIETRGVKDPIIIRNCKDKRNVRYILPIMFDDETEVSQ